MTTRPNYPQQEAHLTLFARKEPVIGCTFLCDDGTGKTSPYNLSGAVVEFYKKARNDDPDPAPIYSTTNGAILVTDAPGGKAKIQVNATHVPRPGQFRYRVDAVKDGHRVVLAWGALTVQSD